MTATVTRRPRRALLLAVAVALPLVGLVAVLATRAPAISRVTDSPLLGKPAPDVRGRTVDGTEFRMADLRGRWVLVNYFATWCVPCRREHPDLVRFQLRHEATGDASVLGVVYDDTAAAVRDFRAEEGGTWPMVLDPDGRIALSYGVAGVPESYLVSPDGFVVSKIVGGVTLDALVRLLAEAQRGVRST